MLVAPPPGFPSASLPPRLENLRRVLTATPELVTRRVKSAIGPYVHPAVLQDAVDALRLSLEDQSAVLEEAALNDMNRKLPTIDTLIAECIDHVRNPGLVDWIVDVAKQDQTIEHVIKLHGYVDARDGNRVRTPFQDFLVFIMDYLGFQNEPRTFLSDVCYNLKRKLPQGLGGEHSELDNAGRAVNRACYGVREITNRYSHTTERMTDADVFELGGCFKALGAALPRIAKEFYKPPPPPPQKTETPQSCDVASLSTLLTSLSKEQAIRLVHGLMTSAQKLSASSASPVPIALSHVHDSRPAAGSSPPPRAAKRGWEVISSERATISPSTSPPRPLGFPTTASPQPPTQEALDAARAYQFFFNRPTEIPADTSNSPVTCRMFRRMINHAHLVPKATLCALPQGHDQSCSKSHSYLEVMKYNPLYKLTTCRHVGHYWGKDTAEDGECMCIHVNTGVDLADSIARGNETRCGRGERCNNQACTRAHSFEEMCWFNPHYKTTKCDPTRCRRPAIECIYAHEGERLRHLDDEDDYVGKNVPMLFIERTHKPLADALEALRFLRVHTP